MSAKRHPGSKKAKKKGRAVKVSRPKPWGLILTFTGVGIVAVGMVAAAAWVVIDRTQAPGDAQEFFGDYDDYWEIVDAMESGDVEEEDLDHPWVVDGTHIDGQDPDFQPVDYPITPPAGGPHHSQWQTCTGIVYDAPLIDEHAVHSLEHGAVWVTYDPEQVSEDEVSSLADKVEGRDFSFMSPYPEQEDPVSLQAWGAQMTAEDASDSDIDRFFQHYLRNSDNIPEPEGTCSGGFAGTIEDGDMGMPGGMPDGMDLDDLDLDDLDPEDLEELEGLDLDDLEMEDQDG